MKFLILVTFFSALSIICKSQYYYNDIVAEQLSQKQYITLKNNHIRKVTALSYESDDQPTQNFSLQQDISEDARTIIINASDPSSGNTTTINNYNNNKIVETKDSTTNVVTVVTYKYNTSGKINSILTVTDDAFMKSHSEELHQWFYTNDQPDSMLRIQNKTDTTVIKFTYDGQGNAVQEDWVKKGRNIETYYYYYNSSKQLTDIVRFNARAQKMLPDYLYNYDANGRVIQMTEVPPGSSDYMIWQYTYNDKGLKQNETLFNREKQLVGRIEYRYQ